MGDLGIEGMAIGRESIQRQQALEFASDKGLEGLELAGQQAAALLLDFADLLPEPPGRVVAGNLPLRWTGLGQQLQSHSEAGLLGLPVLLQERLGPPGLRLLRGLGRELVHARLRGIQPAFQGPGAEGAAASLAAAGVGGGDKLLDLLRQLAALGIHDELLDSPALLAHADGALGGPLGLQLDDLVLQVAQDGEAGVHDAPLPVLEEERRCGLGGRRDGRGGGLRLLGLLQLPGALGVGVEGEEDCRRSHLLQAALVVAFIANPVLELP